MNVFHRLAISLCLALPIGMPAADPLPDELAAIALENRYAIEIGETSITGPGVERLVEEGRQADLFMFGENHGMREIAALARILYLELNVPAPRVLVTEISPSTAIEVEDMLRGGELEAFIRQGVNVHALPFFSVAEEYPLLDAVAAAIPAGTPALWGVDQEFMGGAPLVLRRLEKLARTDDERKAVKSARRASLLNPFLVGMGSGRALGELQQAFKDSGTDEARRITEQLLLSHRIYAEQMGGDGRWSNERRETLMEENLLRYLDDTPQAGRMFLKFGGTHLFMGKGLTVEEPLGLRMSRWAEANGMTSLNMMADCAGGSSLEFLFGTTKPCDTLFTGKADAFQHLLLENGVTLFDLRPLRGHPALDDLSPRLQRLINGYAYYLVVPEAHASQFMPGTLVTHRYGLIAAVLLLAILSGIVFLLLRLLRRRRARKA